MNSEGATRVLFDDTSKKKDALVGLAKLRNKRTFNLDDDFDDYDDRKIIV